MPSPAFNHQARVSDLRPNFFDAVLGTTRGRDHSALQSAVHKEISLQLENNEYGEALVACRALPDNAERSALEGKIALASAERAADTWSCSVRTYAETIGLRDRKADHILSLGATLHLCPDGAGATEEDLRAHCGELLPGPDAQHTENTAWQRVFRGSWHTSTRPMFLGGGVAHPVEPCAGCDAFRDNYPDDHNDNYQDLIPDYLPLPLALRQRIQASLANEMLPLIQTTETAAAIAAMAITRYRRIFMDKLVEEFTQDRSRRFNCAHDEGPSERWTEQRINEHATLHAQLLAAPEELCRRVWRAILEPRFDTEPQSFAFAEPYKLQGVMQGSFAQLLADPDALLGHAWPDTEPVPELRHRLQLAATQRTTCEKQSRLLVRRVTRQEFSVATGQKRGWRRQHEYELYDTGQKACWDAPLGRFLGSYTRRQLHQASHRNEWYTDSYSPHHDSTPGGAYRLKKPELDKLGTWLQS